MSTAEPSLPVFLARRARSASDARLALDFTLGLVVTLAASIWGGPGWLFIASGSACFCAFGLWGIADRELQDRRESASRLIILSLRAARVLACLIGAVGLLVFLLVFLGVALGRLIS